MRNASGKLFFPPDRLVSQGVTVRIRSTAIALAVMSIALAGCASEPPRQVVDFGDVDEKQSGGTFELRVKVLGLQNGTFPLAGAFVGAAAGSQAIAKGTTDADGVATLSLRKGQTIKVVAKADGWTVEDSGSLRIGRASADESAATGAECAAIPAAAWCGVTAGEEEASYSLPGDNGSVSLVLFPEHVSQTFTADAGPQATVLFLTLPDGRSWLPLHAPLNDDPDLHELQMLRFRNATTTLTWENALLEQADFELGVGCDADGPSEETSTNIPYFTTQMGGVMLRIQWSPEDDSYWSTCRSYYAGPVVDTANSEIPVTLTNELVFRGRSTIIPVGE